MSTINDLKGKVINGKNEEVDIDACFGDNKLVGLYFSAHWCPPCRGFTPKLAEWYNKITNHPDFKDKLEIVFISSDQDQAAFDGYFGEMPWVALNFKERGTKDTISDRYGISGIPTLVLLKGDGELATKDGRNIVMQNDPDLLKQHMV